MYWTKMVNEKYRGRWRIYIPVHVVELFEWDTFTEFELTSDGKSITYTPVIRNQKHYEEIIKYKRSRGIGKTYDPYEIIEEMEESK